MHEKSVPSPLMNTTSSKVMFSMSEVKRHNTADSAWIIVHDHVYDCTKFLKDHPGGPESILINAGSDCTKEFDAIHSNKAKELLQDFRIGQLITIVGIEEEETPFLQAARNGIVEMVVKIRSAIPSVIHNSNSRKENVVLVAVKHRQPHVVEALKRELKDEVWNNLIQAVDDDDNTVLHLAAQTLVGNKPWHVAGTALQMMWDIKWYQYIKSLVPQRCYFRSNRGSKTAWEIFETSHESLVENGSEWLKETSHACSVVAALVAGVSFATASQVPGGTNDKGKPELEGQPAFHAFAIASLIGLCFSVTGLIMFLSILTSRKEAKDFRRALPLKLLLGLSSLFASIVAMFVSFCSGHFFIISRKYETFLFSFYAATSIPVAIYALGQFPLYFDLLITIITKVPWASNKGNNF
ncbi:hypothetical protein PIB30_041880 [Stylosanthes scabra]|uniref:Cytochrome b5 heme-binding domain-containing protein n=1 Tax=Stylosanthes scabra TaxID=79078 RepID=A0ABU6WDH9_9FABA|nr:hypothetical protein [Stylosanthes scabra]